MLVLKRREGQWIHVEHKSGDVLRFRVYHISPPGGSPQCNLAFDDAARNFDINRPERFRNAESPALTLVTP